MQKAYKITLEIESPDGRLRETRRFDLDRELRWLAVRADDPRNENRELAHSLERIGARLLYEAALALFEEENPYKYSREEIENMIIDGLGRA